MPVAPKVESLHQKWKALQNRSGKVAYSRGVRFERIAYTRHAYQRMRQRRIAALEAKRILNEPEFTYPSEDEPDRMVARGHLDDGRAAGVVYTEEHEREADALVITVIDFEPEE